MNYSDDQWQVIFTEAANSDLTIKKWCLANDVSYNAFCYHKYSKPYLNRSRDEVKDSGFTTALVRLDIVDCNSKVVSKGFDVNIGKATISVDDSTDLETLTKLIGMINEA